MGKRAAHCGTDIRTMRVSSALLVHPLSVSRAVQWLCSSQFPVAVVWLWFARAMLQYRMIVSVEQFFEAYKRIQQGAVGSACAVLILCAPDCDAMASCRIFTHLLRCDV